MTYKPLIDSFGKMSSVFTESTITDESSLLQALQSVDKDLDTLAMNADAIGNDVANGKISTEGAGIVGMGSSLVDAFESTNKSLANILSCEEFPPSGYKKTIPGGAVERLIAQLKEQLDINPDATKYMEEYVGNPIETMYMIKQKMHTIMKPLMSGTDKVEDVIASLGEAGIPIAMANGKIMVGDVSPSYIVRGEYKDFPIKTISSWLSALDNDNYYGYFRSNMSDYDKFINENAKFIETARKRGIEFADEEGILERSRKSSLVVKMMVFVLMTIKHDHFALMDRIKSI